MARDLLDPPRLTESVTLLYLQGKYPELSKVDTGTALYVLRVIAQAGGFTKQKRKIARKTPIAPVDSDPIGFQQVNWNIK